MIPAAFAYARAGSVAEAVALLAEHGDEAALLAGGHSLLPWLKLRLARPAVLVDLGPCREELGFVRDEGSTLALGALVRHHELAASPLVAAQVPVLAYAAGLVGDPQVRHRGTLGGSLAHGDPAGDLPGVVLALGATLVVQGPDGQREVPATGFFTGRHQTALAPGEVLVEVRVPKVAGAGWSYQRFSRRAHEWPLVAVAAVRHPACGVGLVNLGPVPLRATAVEEAWEQGASPADAASFAGEGTSPPPGPAVSREYRQHLALVLVRRALEEAGRPRDHSET